MTIPFTTDTVLFFITVVSVLYALYERFRKPQDDQKIDGIKLQERLSEVEKDLLEVRKTHLVAMEKDVRDLNTTLQGLTNTVTKLSTIIDERIPKGTILSK